MIELQGDTAEERRAWLVELLQSGQYTVSFNKVDGSQRDMPCTLLEGVVPVRPIRENARTKKYNPETLSVWCLDRQEWRSFRVMNVTAVTPYSAPETTWIVALEEDPETGDLVMPLPPEVLKSQGWEIGDTLEWDFNEETQTATLSKKNDPACSQP